MEETCEMILSEMCKARDWSEAQQQEQKKNYFEIYERCKFFGTFILPLFFYVQPEISHYVYVQVVFNATNWIVQKKMRKSL